MTPIQAPSAAVPGWAFVLAVIAMAAVGWWAVFAPLLRMRGTERVQHFEQRTTPAQRRLPAVIGVLLLITFSVLALTVARRGMGGWDTAVNTFVADHRTDPLSVTAVVLTNLGSPFGSAALMIVVAGVLVRRTGSWLPPLVLMVAPTITAAVNTALKHLIDRTRPPVVNQVVITTDPSFPSGHAAWAVSTWGCIAIALCLVHPNWSRARVIGLCAVPALVVMASRIYLGVHHPSDVLGSALLAGAAVCFTLAITLSVVDRQALRRQGLLASADPDGRPRT